MSENKIEWEILGEQGTIQTSRLKVPGGWILLIINSAVEDGTYTHLITDPHHTWLKTYDELKQQAVEMGLQAFKA